MSNNPMTSIGNSVQRWQQRLFKVEYCTVVEVDKYGLPGVQCHSPDHPEYYNTVTVKVRNAKENIDPTRLQHFYEIVIQDFTGNCFGHPWTPRVGDLVLVLFLYNTQPIILGPVNTTYQAPPFRAPTSQDAMYDEVWKWCQWLRPYEDKNMDYKDHLQGKMPICRKLFHGPVTGAAGGKGRDEMFVWDCQMGDAEPTCRLCEIIDSVPRSGEQWFKQYSTKTESLEAYNSRMEWHSRCGSYLRFESDDENPAGTSSTEYSEKTGHIRLGNAATETDKRGHINFKGTSGMSGGNDGAGTIDIHAEHEDLAFASEHHGARVSVVNNKDASVTFAYESIYFDKNAYIRIMKDGQIVIKTTNDDTEILIESPSVITQDTPLVHMTEDCTIDGHLTVDSITVGSCTHGSCSCMGGGAGGTSGTSTGTGVANQAVAHNMVDNLGTACAPSSVIPTCRGGGSCVITNCDDTNFYMTCTAGEIIDWKCSAPKDGWGDWAPCF